MTFVAEAHALGTTSVTIPKPGSAAAGQLAVVLVLASTTPTAINPPDGTWTPLNAMTNAGAYTGFRVFAKILGSSEPASWVFSTPGAANSGASIVLHSGRGMPVTGEYNVQSGKVTPTVNVGQAGSETISYYFSVGSSTAPTVGGTDISRIVGSFDVIWNGSVHSVPRFQDTNGVAPAVGTTSKTFTGTGTLVNYAGILVSRKTDVISDLAAVDVFVDYLAPSIARERQLPAVDVIIDAVPPTIQKYTDVPVVDVIVDTLAPDVSNGVLAVDVIVDVLPVATTRLTDLPAVDITAAVMDITVQKVVDISVVDVIADLPFVSGDLVLDVTGITAAVMPVTIQKVVDIPPVDVIIDAVVPTIQKIWDCPPVDVIAAANLISVSIFDEGPIPVSVTVMPIDVGFSADAAYYRPRTRTEVPHWPQRIIAQNIRTKEFISWDLPVDDVEYEKTYCGPTIITGSFKVETQEVKDLGLTPHGTMIYVEENTVIRAHGILQPMDLDNGEQLTFEAVGVSAYPNGIPYLSQITNGLNLDPADIIRSIWHHIQSYPDGNLGVVIRGSTSARVGLPEPVVPDPRPIDYEPDPATEGNKPYELNWYDSPDCGEEIQQLFQENNIVFEENAIWNAARTDIDLFIDIYDVRIGTKRDDLRFAEGENILAAIGPEEVPEWYANTIVVHGAGEGVTVVQGYASLPQANKIRRVKVITDTTITTKARADALAAFELARAQATQDIKEIVIDGRHDNAQHGSFRAGDDIFVVTTSLPWFGTLGQWERVLGYRYNMDQETITLRLQRSESFSG